MTAPAHQTAPPPALPRAPHSAALLAGIAAELANCAEQSEQFGIVLCSDPIVAGQYLVQLQQIDKLAQSLREMANVLNAADPKAAVAEIRLGDLRSALARIDGC